MTRPLEDTTARVHNVLKGITLDTLDGSYVLGEILYRRADRYIVRAQRMAASGCPDAPRVVVKFSLCTSPEEKLLNKARKVAIDAGGDAHWVLRHLPNIIHAEDLQLTPDSTQARVTQIIHDVFCHCESCEERVLREDSRPERLHIVIMMEELFPIQTLTTASDFAQVFFDVLNCHKWLYDNPRILHRDISTNNIMYRFDEQRNVCGVLNDMDLSVDLDADLKDMLLLRTGTPPFMAIDLLVKDSHQPEHIYRHDLESLFYVMLIVFARYELLSAEPTCSPMEDRVERLVKRRQPPLSEWFDTNMSWDSLGVKKQFFIMDAPLLTSSLHTNSILSSSFEAFKGWISSLKDLLQDGFCDRNVAIRKAQREGKVLRETFDRETLRGQVQYSTFFDVMKNFGDKALRAPPAFS